LLLELLKINMCLVSIIDEKIRENKTGIEGLVNGIKDLEKQKKQAEKKGIEKWVNNNFYSSSGLTDEFSSFSKDFKKYLKSIAGIDYDLYFSRGHFDCSGFFKNKKTEKFVYFSISDVRYFKNAWYDDVLVRTAKDEKDYTGGQNNSCQLTELKKSIDELTK